MAWLGSHKAAQKEWVERWYGEYFGETSGGVWFCPVEGRDMGCELVASIHARVHLSGHQLQAVCHNKEHG